MLTLLKYRFYGRKLNSEELFLGYYNDTRKDSIMYLTYFFRGNPYKCLFEWILFFCMFRKPCIVHFRTQLPYHGFKILHGSSSIHYNPRRTSRGAEFLSSLVGLCWGITSFHCRSDQLLNLLRLPLSWLSWSLFFTSSDFWYSDTWHTFGAV